MLNSSFIKWQRFKSVYCEDFWGDMKIGREVCKTSTTGGTTGNKTSLPLSKGNKVGNKTGMAQNRSV